MHHCNTKGAGVSNSFVTSLVILSPKIKLLRDLLAEMESIHSHCFVQLVTSWAHSEKCVRTHRTHRTPWSFWSFSSVVPPEQGRELAAVAQEPRCWGWQEWTCQYFLFSPLQLPTARRTLSPFSLTWSPGNVAEWHVTEVTWTQAAPFQVCVYLGTAQLV